MHDLQSQRGRLGVEWKHSEDLQEWEGDWLAQMGPLPIDLIILMDN